MLDATSSREIEGAHLRNIQIVSARPDPKPFSFVVDALHAVLLGKADFWKGRTRLLRLWGWLSMIRSALKQGRRRATHLIEEVDSFGGRKP